VIAARQGINPVGKALILGCILAVPTQLRAQVGLSSAVAQIQLVARVAPRGSVEAVSSIREIARTGNIRESSVTIRFSANTGYRLVVRGTNVSGSRIWVRTANGEFEELKTGGSVTVGRDGHCAGQWEREVYYKIEANEPTADVIDIPVRYEIEIDPIT
jgi:hypothetical protein